MYCSKAGGFNNEAQRQSIVMPKQAKGWLRRKDYAEGEIWKYCFYTCRPTDKKRVENYKIIGLVRDFHSEAEALQEATRLGYWKLLDPSISLSKTFGEIAQHWRKEELTKKGAIGKRAAETITTHESMLDGYILPRWAEVKALNMQPVDIERWFEELALAITQKRPLMISSKPATLRG